MEIFDHTHGYEDLPPTVLPSDVTGAVNRERDTAGIMVRPDHVVDGDYYSPIGGRTTREAINAVLGRVSEDDEEAHIVRSNN